MHFALVGKSDKRFHLLLPEKCLHYPNYGGRFADVCCLHRYPAVLWCPDHRLEPKNHANCEGERRYTHIYSRSELQAAICARLRMTATAPLASTGSAMREPRGSAGGRQSRSTGHFSPNLSFLRWSD